MPMEFKTVGAGCVVELAKQTPNPKGYVFLMIEGRISSVLQLTKESQEMERSEESANELLSDAAEDARVLAELLEYLAN